MISIIIWHNDYEECHDARTRRSDKEVVEHGVSSHKGKLGLYFRCDKKLFEGTSVKLKQKRTNVIDRQHKGRWMGRQTRESGSNVRNDEKGGRHSGISYSLCYEVLGSKDYEDKRTDLRDRNGGYDWLWNNSQLYTSNVVDQLKLSVIGGTNYDVVIRNNKLWRAKEFVSWYTWSCWS